MHPDTPSPEQPAPDSTSPEPPEQSPSCTKRPTGKVARLPDELREQLNQMLHDGLPYKQIIQALGEPAKHLNEDNIGNWKSGKHKLWLDQLQRREDLADLRAEAKGIVNLQAATPVQDAGRSIASAQIYELLLAFEPSAFVSALADKPELYVKLVNALSRLCQGQAACAQRRAMQPHAQSKTEAMPDAAATKSPTKETLQDIAQHIKLV